MNNVVIIGRIATDLELRHTQSGQANLSFSVAVDKGLSRSKKDEYEAQGKPTADFPRVVAWDKTAELIANYTAKGLMIAVQGRIQTGRYTNKEGQTVYTTDIVADRVEFLEWKNGQTDTNAGQSNDDFIPFKDDSAIPF